MSSGFTAMVQNSIGECLCVEILNSSSGVGIGQLVVGLPMKSMLIELSASEGYSGVIYGDDRVHVLRGLRPRISKYKAMTRI